MNTKTLPKILLHIHLDGSVRVKTANELLDKDVESAMKIDKECLNLSEYLTKFKLPLELMQTKENIERISKELALDLKEDNVIYVEIRFSPLLHQQKYLSLEEILDSVIKGLKQVNLKTNIILCMMRNYSIEDNKKIIYLAQKHLNNHVVALDLAGDEYNYKTKDFKELFDLAKELHIPYTIHAGEADDYRSIDSAISFDTKRIGHGIRCIENSDTLNNIITNNITLEVCPKSNIDTKVVKDYKNHPIKQLLDKGVKVTINTDNNTVSNITLTEEYNNLIKYLNFTKKDLFITNINAINASFLPNKEKETLTNIIKEGYGE